MRPWYVQAMSKCSNYHTMTNVQYIKDLNYRELLCICRYISYFRQLKKHKKMCIIPFKNTVFL